MITSKLDCHDTKLSTTVLPDGVTEKDISLITRNDNHYYLQFNFQSKTTVLPHQGFKIHISPTWKNYLTTLNKIFEFCKEENLAFKYISNKAEILKNLSGNVPLWTAGKFITIYPPTFKVFKNIIYKLYLLPELKEKPGIYILTDRRYKDSNNIFYRYGIINGPDKNIYDLNGNRLYEDYHELKYKLPKFIQEPFPQNIYDHKRARYIFKKYIPTKGINSKASGSVFEAKYKKQDVILKNAKFGFEDFEYTEIEKLKNEERFLKILKNESFIPRYIDSFHEDKDYFLVESKVQGVDVDTFRALPRYSFSNKNNNREKLFNTFSNVIINLLRNLSIMHSKGIFLGDISARNVVIDLKTNDVYFVDLGQTTFVKLKKPNIFYRTKGFYDESISQLSLVQQDNRQMGYLIMALFTRANMFLKIDFTGNMSISFFKKFAEVNNIPSIFVDIIMKLIFNPNVKLEEIISLLQHSSDKVKFQKKEYCFPATLLYQLSKSCLISQIDGIKFNESKYDLCSHKCKIESNDYTRIEMKCMENTETLSKDIFNSKLPQQILHDLKKLSIDIQDKNIERSYVYSLSLGKIISLLFCSINLIQQTSENEIWICKIKNIMKFIEKNYKINQNNKIGYKINYSSTFLSPYLYDGVAGILNLYLMLKEKFKINENDTLIIELAHSLVLNLMPKSASFKRGLAGIVHVLIKYRKMFGDNSIDESIKIMTTCFDSYTYLWNDNKYIVNTHFSKATINFEEGNKGIIKVLKESEFIFEE